MRFLTLAALLFFIPLSAALAQVAPTPIPVSLGGGGGFTFVGQGTTYSIPEGTVFANPMNESFSFSPTGCFAEGAISAELAGNALEVTMDVTSTSGPSSCQMVIELEFDLVSAIQTNGESVAMIYADAIAVTLGTPPTTSSGFDRITFRLSQTSRFEIESVLRGTVGDTPYQPVEVDWRSDEPVASAGHYASNANAVYGFAQPGDALTVPMKLNLAWNSWTTGTYSARFEFVQVSPQPVSSIGPGLGLPLGVAALLGLASLKG